MKRLAAILILLLPIMAAAQDDSCVEVKEYPLRLQWLHIDDCEFEVYNWETQISDIYPLMGRVRLVESGGTIRVKLTAYTDADLIVRATDTVLRCGDWHFVESGERFAVQYVDDDSWHFRIHILTAEEEEKYRRVIIRSWIDD